MMFHPFDRDLLAHDTLASDVDRARSSTASRRTPRSRRGTGASALTACLDDLPAHRRRSASTSSDGVRVHGFIKNGGSGGEHHPGARRGRVLGARPRHRGARPRARHRRALRRGAALGERGRASRSSLEGGYSEHGQQHGRWRAASAAPARPRPLAARDATPRWAPARPTWATCPRVPVDPPVDRDLRAGEDDLPPARVRRARRERPPARSRC